MPNSLVLNGADLLVELLKSKNVDQIFCITGAGNLAIVDSLARDGSINLTYSHHEQAAVMEAQGYARISGKPGVALVTTGGGTSNVITGILSSHLDSVPVLLISGNESSFHCDIMSDFRAYGVQGFDSVAVIKPISKFSERIMSGDLIPEVFSRAWDEMLAGRPGPSHIDFPMDVQRSLFDSTPNKVISAPEKTSVSVASEVEISKVVELLTSAKRPVLYLGAGATSKKSIRLLSKLKQLHSIPHFVSWSAIDAFPDSDAQNFGRVGIYGDRFANILLQKSDLVIAIGTRLSIPQVGYDREDFGRKAKKIVVDIDKIELSKNTGRDWFNIHSRVEDFIDSLVTAIEKYDGELPDLTDWLADGLKIRKDLPRLEQIGPRVSDEENYLHSIDVMDFLNAALEPNAIIATDVGAALLSGHYALTPSGGQRLFTSQGLGEMGFGLPGALGAHFADKGRQLVCLNTDGAMMFNLQELQLVSQEKIPLKLFVFNNDGYSMIKISQENLFERRFAGSGVESGVTFPKFRKIAEAFGLRHTLVTNKSEMGDKIGDALSSDRAELIEIRMDPNQKYFPRLATSRSANGSLISPPLEDLDPKIDLSLLESLLGYVAHESSYKSRGLDRDE